MARKYVAFDLEIVKGFPDGADWRGYRPLGISCAATLAADAQTPTLWYSSTADDRPADAMNRQDLARLVDHLKSMVAGGYTVLTWNGLGFDFDVLAEESGKGEECRALAVEHVDMMFHVFCEQGYPVGLDAAARGMNLPGKLEGMSGLLAPQMWAEGKRQQVLDYVAQDVRMTLDLAVACEKQSRFRWVTRRGTTQSMALPGGWLTVDAAMKLPQPDTSWMSKPIPRRNFTGWLRS
ncbi:MAG TPA: ribonuclease H-like domain-containing protein [Thermoguttaceae bacterium]|nr:ribonuclease H-like domain-containing protein [Thermoguttaceae bacterium]